MNLNIRKLKMWLNLIFFFPFYFTLEGVYKASSISGNYSEGAVFSGLFILVFIIVLLFFFNKLNFVLIKDLNFGLLLLLILVLFLFAHTLVGYLFFDSFTIFIVNGQFVAALSGLLIAHYFIFNLNYKVQDILLSISILFIFALLSNLIVSIYVIGIDSTFGRNIWPSTFLSGIYHHWVYYPYIVSFVCLFSLPIWFKKSKYLALVVYILFLFYILIFQVRGAIISFLIGSIVFAFKYIKIRKIYYLIGLVIVPTLFYFFPLTRFVGRFYESPIQMLSHRLPFIQLFLSNFTLNSLYIFIGSISKLTLYGIERNTTAGIITLHNQYLNLIDNYGVFVAIYVFSIIIGYLVEFKKRLNQLPSTQTHEDYTYWFYIIITILSIDLNINEQLTTGNPGVYLTFYLGIILFSLVKQTNEKQNQNINEPNLQ